MTRPRLHPLAILMGMANLAIILWLQSAGFLSFDSPSWLHPSESAIEFPSGWPLGFRWQASVCFERLVLNMPFWTLLIALPTYTLQRLMNRDLQLRLATGIVLMLVAEVLLGANLIPRDYHPVLNFANMYPGDTHFGWPQPVFIRQKFSDVLYGVHPSLDFFEHWRVQLIAANALIALTILSAVALLCEKVFFRRRASQNNPPSPEAQP